MKMKVCLCVMLMLCDMSGLTSSHHISIDYSEPSITSIGNVQHLHNVFLPVPVSFNINIINFTISI